MDIKNKIINKIKQIKTNYINHKINSQNALEQVYNLKSLCTKVNLNLLAYFKRNGIFTKNLAIKDIKNNLKHYTKFPNKQKVFKKELKQVKNSQNQWFENYGIHDGNHDLIKTNFDTWKITAFLNSLLCDLYVGTYNEH